MKTLALVLTLFFVLVGYAPAREPVTSRNGMVTSAHPLASEAGLEMLRAGGNAVDAAVAAAFAIGVVEPYGSGLGGGGFALAHICSEGRNAALDYREVAPSSATAGMYLDKRGEIIPDLSLVGHRAAAVPGTTAGLLRFSEEHGVMQRRELLAPAIRLAEQGFEVTEDYRRKATVALESLRRFPESARIFLDADRNVPPIGYRIVQKDLANTLRLISEKGQSGFYRGPVAEAIAAEMASQGGLVSLHDLKTYRTRFRQALKGTYRGYELLGLQPPSSGGVHLFQILGMLERFSLKSGPMDDPARTHLMVESMRRAYADRATHLGDPAFVRVPVNELISPAYLDQLKNSIDPDKASPSAGIQAGDPTRKEGQGNTTHLCAVDADRNVAAITQSLNGWFGSGVVVPGTGILLNNTMDDFAAKPGVPNLYGLVGAEANAIAPRKVPLSSMSPTIVLKEGKPVLTLGTPGGSRIITTVLEVFLNVVDHGMNVQEAVDRPRFHHQWLPDEIQYEAGAFSESTAQDLRRRGHTLTPVEPYGNAMAIQIDADSGNIYGAADSRGIGQAVGY